MRIPKYVRVTKFDEYQHGGDGTKWLPWVKLYVSTLTSDVMLLPPSTFKLFVCLLLIARRRDNRVTTDRQKLAKFLHLPSSQITAGLQELLAEGLIEPFRVETEARPDRDGVESSRARVRASASDSSSGTGANLLVAHYCDRVKGNGDVLTDRVKGQTAREIKKLIAEGIDHDLIRLALELMADKGRHPSVLPALVMEVQRTGNGKRFIPTAELLAMTEGAMH